MADAVINHRLDLMIRFIDTTTGTAISERTVKLKKNGQDMHMISKGGGIYICINQERENFLLHINIYGYEEKTILIDYSLLDAQMPIRDIYMIPKENNPRTTVLSLNGIRKGISDIQAVNISSSNVFIQEYDERKRIISLFNPHKLKMQHVFYGIVHNEKEDYEIIQLDKRISYTSVKINPGLQKPFQMNDPVERIIFGSVTENGEYLLRVQDNSNNLIYLVKYTIDGVSKCMKVDFHNLKEVNLI